MTLSAAPRRALALCIPLFASWFAMGCDDAAGLSAPGTLYAAMTSRIRSQDVLLPLLLFPLVVPVLMATVKAAALILTGDPMEQIRSWVLLLVGFDVIYWSLCGILFPHAIEEDL